jgi:hypothetical protein
LEIKTMSAKTIARAWTTTGISPCEKLVLLMLADNAGENEIHRMGMEHFVNHCSMSHEQFTATLNSLKHKGLADWRMLEDGQMAFKLFGEFCREDTGWVGSIFKEVQDEFLGCK